jgi:hypothetical protein
VLSLLLFLPALLCCMKNTLTDHIVLLLLLLLLLQATLVLSLLPASCRSADPQLLPALRGELLYMARIIEQPVSGDFNLLHCETTLLVLRPGIWCFFYPR